VDGYLQAGRCEGIVMEERIFVIKDNITRKFRFFDREELMGWLKVEVLHCNIPNFRLGYIDPELDDLEIHVLDIQTVEAMMDIR
jgi:hypothetical protein